MVSHVYCPQLGNSGRLGNQLWQIASTAGVAAAMDADPAFPPWEYQSVFSVPEEFFGEPAGVEISTLISHLPDVAKPYLQDYGLWKDIASTIRDWFRPTIWASAIVDTYPGQKKLQQLPRPWVALHVRRGDLATAHLRQEEGYHPLRPMSYYEEALERCSGSLIVFSDDIPWCKQNLDADHFFEGGPPRPRETESDYRSAPVLDWIDLLAMPQCDQFILSNSTYSWWGAWLSGKSHVIYPWPWFGPKLREIDASLMFPSEWTRLTHKRVV